jgi:hypothetical protein
MDTSTIASEIYAAVPTFRINQDEALNKDGHQNWHRLVLHDFNNGEQFEGVIHKYESWSEPSDEPDHDFRGVRGEGDIEKNRERAARRAKKRIRHSCKSAKFDRMLTLTTRDSIFDRDEFQRMIEKFIRLVRKASGDAMPYVLTVEKHDSIKTSEAKRGSLHAHVAVRGRQDYKLLQSIWNHRVCGGRGFVRVSNGTKKMNSGSIASYISKYISKSISDVAANKKSYWISHNIAAPVRTVKLFKTFLDAVSWLIAFYDSKGATWGFDRWRCWQDASLGVLWLPAG